MTKLLLRSFAVFIASTMLLSNQISMAESLDVDRLVASPSLNGAVSSGVKISPDGTRVTYLQGKPDNHNQQDLWEYNIVDGQKRLLVDSQILLGGDEALDEVEIARRERQRIFASGIIEYDFSPDGKALLFPLGGDIYYYEIDGKAKRLTHTAATETDAKISPLGGYVSYVRQQNLYIYDLATNKEKALTSKGAGSISYGLADFAAQEEMYRFSGYWWSKDDSHIAFTKVDESNVHLMQRYEIAADGVTTIPQRYPFAGTANPVVELYTINLSTNEVEEVDLGKDKDFYLARVNYSPDGTLAVQKQSRDQKTLDLIFVDPTTMNQTTVLSEHSDTWINLHSDLTFVAGGAQFIWTSERTGYNHAYLYNKDGSLERILTEGEGVLSAAGRAGGAIRAVDEDADFLYVTGSMDTPLEKHLYQVPLAGGEIKTLTQAGGWHDVALTAGGSFFVDKGQSPMRPPYTAIRQLDGTLLTYIEENSLDETHPYYPYLDKHSDRVFGELTADDGTTLHYQMYLPPAFDEHKKYPALVFHYGGPGPQMVRKAWQMDIKQVLAQNGYIVFSLDNRGSGNRGKAFEEHLYKAMGGVEVVDQALGANYLKSLPYVDATNMGVFGWSYGGYMTLMMMMKEPDLYKAGVAGAPVVDWKLYDTHYTERYLGNPLVGDPLVGDVYEVTSPISYVDGLKGDLLVIHGMADDNVFFDNTVMLMSALQDARKQFDLMTYPGKRHRITGSDATAHVWQLHLDFFNDKLKREEEVEIEMSSPTPARNPFPR